MDLPSQYFIGQEIDWDAVPEDVIIKVELPFWFFCDNAEFKVQYADREWDVGVRSDYADYYYGLSVPDSKENCVYHGPVLDEHHGNIAKYISTGNIILRKCKSVITIRSPLNGWVAERLSSYDDKEYRLVNYYLISWCAAHIPIVNEVIQTYRVTTYDYHAYEVSPRDIPVWFVSKQEEDNRRIVIYPYSEWDEKPDVIEKSTAEDLKLAEYAAIEMNLGKKRSPSEYELMDAIGLMERGDYSSAVRRMHTAIEVIVAERLEIILTDKLGVSEKDRFMKETRVNFDKRIKRLCQETGISLDKRETDYIDELRDLRVKIVHYGYRIGESEKGNAQRMIDWGRWLYNGFEGKPEFAKVRESNLAKRSFGRFMPLYYTTVGPKGVEVHSPMEE